MGRAADCQAVRIDNLNLTIAWMVCRMAGSDHSDAISKEAAEFGLPASIVRRHRIE